MERQKRVLAVHDISGVGRCSLTVALPIISAAGIECSALPTAVLSTHTGGFTGYTFRDLTADLLPMAEHWGRLDVRFDAIYTGYLGSFATKLEHRKPENAAWAVQAYKIVKPETPDERLDRELGFAWYMNHRVYEYRKWLFYLLHRDLLDVVFDGEFYTRVRFAVLSTLCLFEMGSLEWKSRNKHPGPLRPRG